jgi:hypothetical protein
MLPLLHETVGPEHAYVGAVLGRIGRAERALGRLHEAEQAYRESLALLRAAYPDGNARTGDVAAAYADLIAPGRPAAAAALLLEAQATCPEGSTCRRRADSLWKALPEAVTGSNGP